MDIVLPSAGRWVRRRLTLVRARLLAIVTLLPEAAAATRISAPSARRWRHIMRSSPCARAASLLSALPRPRGFARQVRLRNVRRPRRQYHLGADLGPSTG